MTLARYTPSVLDGATLEKLFVHRHDVLEDTMRRIEDAATSGARRHKLIVGPRGAGKTHLISLVNHRATRRQVEGLEVAISWLDEDPWEIETLDDLLEQIAEHLVVDGLSSNDDGSLGLAGLRQVVAQRGPITVLVENLDRMLGSLDGDDQRRLRGLLENERLFLLIATATRLGDELLSQVEPFYGFFDVTNLEPFTVAQAADMLAEIADVSGNDGLAALLHTPQGTARIATIAHLAGGQPRVWALLGTGLSTTGIDDMISMLLARFDDLTPYYQEQLARLSPSEAKVVRRLADADRPLTIRALAELARVDQRSIAKTVSDLRRRGWVRRHESVLTAKTDARLTYYDLAEPLARIAFQIKSARGRPIRLVLDFLATWYDLDQLGAPVAGESDRTSTYRQAAAERFGPTMMVAQALGGSSGTSTMSNDGGPSHPVVSRPEFLALLASVDDALAAFADGDAEAVLAQPAAISRLVEHRAVTSTPARLRLDIAWLAMADGAADAWADTLEVLVADAGDPADRLRALTLLVEAEASTAGTSPSVDTLIDRLVSEMSKAADAVAAEVAETALPSAERLMQRHRFTTAGRIADLMCGAAPVGACSVGLASVAADAMSRVGLRGQAHQVLSNLVARTHAGQHDGGDLEVACRNVMARWCRDWGDAAGALTAFEELLIHAERTLGPDDPTTLITRSNVATCRAEAGDVAGAVGMSKQLVPDCLRVLGADHPDTLACRFNLAWYRTRAGDVAGAMAALQELLADRMRVSGPDHPDTLTTRHNLAFARGETGDAAGAVAALEGVLVDRLRVLGADHPDALATRHNLASWRVQAGDATGAAAELTGLVVDRLRVLGPDHPDTLATRHNLAYAQGEAGDGAGAVAAFEQLMSDQRHVLGSDHPATSRTRQSLEMWRVRVAE